jgi:hypothetical protein
MIALARVKQLSLSWWNSTNHTSVRIKHSRVCDVEWGRRYRCCPKIHVKKILFYKIYVAL